MKAGNFERECIEENCDVEELAEVFDNTDVSEPIQLKYDKCSKIVTAGKIPTNYIHGVNSHVSNKLTPNDSSPFPVATSGLGDFENFRFKMSGIEF